MKANTTDITLGIDFTLILQTYSYMRKDAALYATQVLGDYREFLNTCWARLQRMGKLTAYRIRRFKELKREYIKALNRYYHKLETYYRLHLNGVALSQADHERYMIQTKLYKLAD